MDTVMHIIGYALLLGERLYTARGAVASDTAFFEVKETMGISIIPSERAEFSTSSHIGTRA